jgi:hypothetical protein
MTHATEHFTTTNRGGLNVAFDQDELHIDYLAERLVEVAAGYGRGIDAGLAEIARELEIPLGRFVQTKSNAAELACHLASVHTESVTAFLAKHP